jgi:phage terminase small subunit
MTRGRKPDPGRGRRVTRPPPHQVVEPGLFEVIASELPQGLPRDIFKRAVGELAGRLNDTDLEALRMMAWSLYRHEQAQQHVEDNGIMVDTPFGPKLNPMLKLARDEGTFYLRIADQYALTFVGRLRAGLLQLAGQSLMKDLHSGIAAAIVARITDGK